MKSCQHAEHADAHVDSETGWIITGDEAWLPEEWAQHTSGWLKRRIERNKERYAKDDEFRERARRYSLEWKRRNRGAA